MKKAYNSVPVVFRNHLTLEEHQKSIRYALAKSRVSKFKLQFDTLLLLGLLPLGGINWLDQFVRQSLSAPLMRGVSFFLILILASSIISLPFKLYSTFVIEDNFGFNNTTIKTFFTDFLKQLVLIIAIATPLLFAILWLFENLGSLWWLYAFIMVTLFQFILIWLYPTIIAPMFNKFSSLDKVELENQIKELSLKTGFEASAIQVMDASKRSSHGNAYFTGLGKKKKIVFFDTLLKHLKDSEVLAVLAHELGHFAKKHIVKMLAVSLISSLLGFALLGSISPFQVFYSGHFIAIPSSYSCLFIFMTVMPLYTFFLTPLSSWMSRRHEFEADEFAAKYTSVDDLTSALMKLQKENSSVVVVDPAYSFFYYSHPPLVERLEHLKKVL